MATTRKRTRTDVTIASSLAIAVSLVSGGMIARAQSFQISGYSVPAGSATVFAGTNTTDIQVFSNDAVINWTPSDTAVGGGPIIFQPNGTTATFSGNTGFTVLNRIVPTDPTRAIEFDGSVVSQFAAVSGPPVTGGTVFFYSPGGIILGSTATFDVGNLGLTASDVTYDATGAFGGANGTVVFQQATQPGAAIQVSAGAQINALNAGSYVAMVAPSVVHGGSINVNGSAALVAAEGATINFSPDGLFDIQVTTGTNGNASGVAIDSTGTITGAAGSGLTQSHRVYMVAVPKNTAISMLIGSGSQLGFDVAAAADTDGNAVVLSGGYDVTGGNANYTSPSAGGGTGQAAISVANSTLLSALTASATGTNDVLADDGLGHAFFSNLTMYSPVASRLSATNAVLSIAGNVNVVALDPGTLANVADGANLTGGIATVLANTSSGIDIAGDLTVTANGTGGSSVTPGVNAGTGTGGTAAIGASNSGRVSVGGVASVFADGYAGSGLAAGIALGAGVGGTASVHAQDGGTLTFGGLSVSASGLGNQANGTGVAGAAGTGGTASLYAQGTASSINITGAASLQAQGVGGSGNCVTCTVDGGAGTGGTAQLFTSGSGQSVTIGGLGLDVTGQGGGGNGGAGGVGAGGTLAVSIDGNSTLTVNGPLAASAVGLGGGQFGGLDGGAGLGGTAGVQIAAGSTFNSNNQILLYSTGTGGGSVEIFGGTGGAGTGGTSTFDVAGNATLTNGPYQLDASGIGGDGTSGGKGTGGSAAISTTGAGTLNATAGASGSFGVAAYGTGGTAIFSGGRSGDAQGGIAQIFASGGTMNLNGAVTIESTAYAAPTSVDGVDGGDGIGGTSDLQSTGGSLTVTGDVLLRALGNGSGNQGGGDLIAGNGTGGTTFIASSNAGSVTVNASAISLFSDGFGGNGTSTLGASSAGAGTGGNATVAANGGTLSLSGTLYVSADGSGGTTSSAGNGGAGVGGVAQIYSTGGSLSNSGSYTLTAQGSGGAATVDGSGGAGTGGTAALVAQNTPTLPAASLTLGGGSSAGTLTAQGFGGTGMVSGVGGAGTGGSTFVANDGGTVTLTGGLAAYADAYGGQGTGSAAATGGAGVGGSSGISTTNSGTTSLDTGFTAYGLGIGGNQLSGGTGGIGTGGRTYVVTYNSGSLSLGGSTSLYSSGTGGSSTAVGGIGASGTGGQGYLTGDGGTLSVNGDAYVDSSGFGGQGDQSSGAGSGGAGTGGTAVIGSDGQDSSNTGLGAGSLSITGTGTAFATGTGGSGGSGGAGLGGTGTIVARLGQATLGQSVVSVVGGGGAGIAGGAGGTGTGGTANVVAVSSLSGSSSLNAGAVTLTADGTGGAGGAGLAVGQAGGAGGAGIGGAGVVDAASGNGTLTATTVYASAFGVGGAGGAGYSGTGPTGGDGGLGGDGTGGAIQVGTESGLATPDNTGSASYSSISLFALGNGGVGGDAGTGAATTGTGGNGGTGNGGGATLLVRGSPVTITGNVVMGAGGNGGAAGAGAPNTITGGATVSKDGGPGLIGGVDVVVTNRFLQPAQRGTLTVGGSITGTASAIDGTGFQSNFTSMGSDPIEVTITNSDVNVTGGLNLYASANQLIAGATPALVDMSGSTANFGTGFAFNTLGDLTLNLDSTNLIADGIDLGASNWILGAAPTAAGTLVAGSGLRLYTAQDLVTYANLQTFFDTTLSAPGSIQLGNVDTTGAFSATALGGSILLGNGTATDFALNAATDLTMGTLNASGYATFDAGGAINTGALTVARSADLTSVGATTVGGTIQAGADVTFNAGGNVAAGDISSGIVTQSAVAGDGFNIGIASGGAVTAGTLRAQQFVGVGAQQTITTGAVSGAAVLLLGGGNITIDSINSGSQTLIADYSMVPLGGTLGPSYNPVPVFAATPVATAGAITINGTISSPVFSAATTNSFASGGISGLSAFVNAGGPLTVSGPISTGVITAFSSGSQLTVGDVTTGFAIAPTSTQAISLSLYGATGVTTGNLTATRAAVVLSQQNVSMGTFQGADFLGLAGGSLSTGAINATGEVELADISMAVLGQSATGFNPYAIFAATPVEAGGTISTGAINSGSMLQLAAVGGVTVGGAISTGDDTNIRSSGNIVTADIAAGIINPTTGPGASHTIALLSSGGAISVDNLQALDKIGLIGPHTISTGQLTAGNDMLILGGGDMLMGPVTSGGRVLIADYSMAPLGGAFDGNYQPDLVLAATPVASAGAITVNGAVSTTGFFHAATASNFTSSAIVSGGDILLDVGGILSTGLLSSTGGLAVNAGSAQIGDTSATGAISLTSAGTLTTGALSAAGSVTVSSGGALATGAVTSTGGAVVLTSTGQIGTGAISAATSMSASTPLGFTSGNITAPGGVSVSAGTTLAAGSIASPTSSVQLSSGTSMALGGPVTASVFQADAGNNLAAGTITAGSSLSATAGGTMTVNGQWAAPTISLVSNDLDIAAPNTAAGIAGRLNAGTAGQISLESTNLAGMFIGDGLAPGNGYAISNAEWGRINSGSVSVAGVDNPQLSADMTIGTLTITGPLAGSTIDDPNGSVSFATGYDGIASGTMRVVGNVAATGFTGTNTLRFDATAFELDAATGSIKIDDAAGKLSGILEVSADFIHIAQGSILDKLRSDPFYAQRFADLNAPAAVQRPDGVFNALAFDLYPGQTLYIQNTGTAAVPAGFISGFSVSDVTPPDVPPTGGISVIINGAFDTPSGLVSGAAAYNLLVNDPEVSFTGIATDSTLNGCALSVGSCGSGDTINPTSGEFQTLAADKLGDEPFTQQEGDSSQEQEDEAQASAATSKAPIAPPAPLISTRPLRPPVNITEPLTGGGNPALLGAGNTPGNGGAQ